MARTKISEFSATAADNTDIDNIDIAEGCAPSGINNAIRELMAQLKDFQTGAAGDPFNGAVNGTVGATTPAAGAFTTLSASSTVSGTGFSNYFASPPAIGGTAAAAGTFTNLAYTGTLTGGTGVINIGSGQVYKDASGNVGIGTTFTAQRLHVASTTSLTTIRSESALSGSSYFSGLEFVRSSVAAGSIFQSYRNTAVGGVGFVWSTTADNAAEVAGTYTQRMFLDSTGNLGLGVTPSAWSLGKAIEVNNAGNALWGVAASEINVSQNAYYNGGWKYGANGFATRFEQNSGQHRWHTAPSGTAGNAISFTQAMTLTANSELIIGTTSTGGVLRVYGATGKIIIGDSSFNYFDADTQIFRSSGGTERARIDSSGNLLVGTTSAIGRVTIQKAAGAADGITMLADSGGAGYSFATSTSTGTPAYFATTSGQAGLISVSGNTTSYTSGSDYRLKENIRPLTNALEKVSTLKPVAFEWKTSGSYSESFLAHELAESFPFAVIGEKDAVDADGNPKYQGIDTSFLVATLVAAIQELKAEVDALKAAV